MGRQSKGYYRYPTIRGDRIVFVAEDDLWVVDAGGGAAHRLTANLGAVTHPCFSGDGEWLAFTGREEGHAEVYLMPSSGGPAERLTYLGRNSFVVGWHDREVVFPSDVGRPFANDFWLYAVDVEGGEPRRFDWGPARNASWGKQGVVIGRNTGDPARWKRYRGGTAGEIWIDQDGAGQFRKLITLDGNLANPMWIRERIFFLSDHQGIGNLYSCLPDGEDLKAHTHHTQFYARNASTDGRRIVYHAGADIHVLDPETGESREIEIEYASPQVQQNRKYVVPAKYFEDYALCEDGSMLALVHRGKMFTMGNWEGPVLQHGVRNGVRYRLAQWLRDGKRLVLASDEGRQDHLELHWVDGSAPPTAFMDVDVGRPQRIEVSPTRDEVLLTNHRHELVRVDLETGTGTTIDRSEYGPIAGFGWSPDGNWIAYSVMINRRVRAIKVYSRETGEIHAVTEPILNDYAPVFDPAGKYLYFLSGRVFDPVYDNLHFDLGFPKGVRPYAVTLRRDIPSPFVPEPRGFGEGNKGEKVVQKEEEGPKETDGAGSDRDQAADTIEIDFDGIQDRIVAFPVREAIYQDMAAIKDKVFYTVYPVEGALDRKWFEKEPPVKACLKVYDLEKLEEAVLVSRLTSFRLSGDGSAVACRIGNRLRIVEAKRDPSKALPRESGPSRKTGWIDLARVRVPVEPTAEWQQMFGEAWRLQRDYFWVEDMSGVDWDQVRKRYEPLVERVACRSEFSDLLWEMQGELGTSHAYELGGDYRPEPEYKLGYLGADLTYDAEHDAYRFSRLPKGDGWDAKNPPPLSRPGVNVEEGMLLLAIGGDRVGRRQSPSELLVNRAGQEVQLTIADADGDGSRTVCVRTVADETPVRYRDWVEGNRQYVHEQSAGKVGYLHIPDMGPRGYAEFHRYFLVELDHKGLIVDVRFNGGGHVSSLLLEKLAQQRLGYDLTRWMGDMPFPEESVYGPVVALTNEQAGSDGDIFCHSFKLMKLGKLLGRRTWGGVVGIWPRNWLVDGTLTTQPEFSFWFKDAGWGVENYGTDPDIEVDITPQDYARGVDTQLDEAIRQVLHEIENSPPQEPRFESRPRRTLPGE